jgi:ariadne-1
MSHKCNAIYDEDIVRKIVSTKFPEATEGFERFLLESFTDDNKKVKWCPSVPNNRNAIQVEGDVFCEFECTCRKKNFFKCLAIAHSPYSCLMWEL